ncbi:MAG: clostripain-related cysteine peptidase [bacterium]
MKRSLWLILVVGLWAFMFAGCGGGGGGGGPVGPSVSILSPANNSTVSGTITIEASATSSIGISRVEFYVDDQKVGEATSLPYTCSWNADSCAYGTKHSIYAKAQDSAGNWGTSAKISITIGDSQAPQLTITYPSSNIVPVSALIPIRVSVQDRGGKTKAPSGIQKVEFYVDGNKIGEVPGNSQLSGTFECPNPWDTSGLKHNTTHTITVKATDNIGLTGETTFQVTMNAEWTVLIYADAHQELGQQDDLHPSLQTHIQSLQTNLSSTQGINVVALKGAYPEEPDSIIYFSNGKYDTIEGQLNVNFGDPAWLSAFLKTEIQNFPAKRYLVILWDHGSGWRKRQNATRDICGDDYHNNDWLTIPELKQALQDVVSFLGRKIDVLLLNACVMGTIEVDYQLRDLADYLVSSEASMIDAELWGESLKKLVSNPTMPPRDLAITIADTYYKQAYNVYQQGKIQQATIAAKDLSRIDQIANDIYYFAHYLRDCVPSSASVIMNLRDDTTNFEPYTYYIDLYEFANLVASNTTYDALKTAAQNLMGDIDSSLLYYKFFGFNYAKGYSIWFPHYSEVVNDPESVSKWRELDFATANCGKEWYQFLEELQAYPLGKGRGKVSLSKHR